MFKNWEWFYLQSIAVKIYINEEKKFDDKNIGSENVYNNWSLRVCIFNDLRSTTHQQKSEQTNED